MSVIARWWMDVKNHKRWKVESGKHKLVACGELRPRMLIGMDPEHSD